MRKTILSIMLIFCPIILLSQINLRDPTFLKQKGDEQYIIFDTERQKQIMQEIIRDKPNEDRMYEALLNLYHTYIKADSLSQSLEDNEMGQNSNVKYISGKLIEVRPYYIYAGAYYNDKKEYSKASESFEIYWNYPLVRIFSDTRATPLYLNDTITEASIKYYAIVTSIIGNDNERSIYLLNRLISEPYIPNETYKESDLYELLAEEYKESEDFESYMAILGDGIKKFPDNPYFLPSFINGHLSKGNTAEAMRYINDGIKNRPENFYE